MILRVDERTAGEGGNGRFPRTRYLLENGLMISS